MSEHRIESLRRAVAASPEDAMLRLMLAEELASAGQHPAALDEYDWLLHHDADLTESLVHIGELAAAEGRLPLLRACLEHARQAGIVEGVGKLQRLVDELLTARGAIKVTADGRGGERPAGPAARAETLTFDQVGGMTEVKQLIHRMIILPLSRPELYAKYGRRTGGGVLLYGPPGCGKTMMARATAGECGLPFVNIRIEDVMDPYLGVSEQNLHTAFESARAQAPCVLFLDELDALAFSRHKHHGSDARRLVDVLLQELDAIGSDNDGVLVLAATNAPWDVDEAMLRPGRFDRVVFVPPPDEPARAEILRVLLAAAPTDGVDPARLAEPTALFSGADLRAVTERAIDAVIDEALRTGSEPPLRMAQLEQAVAQIRPSTVDWLVRAKAYVEFANQSERYSDVAQYLATKEVRRRLSR
ncbi:AAA family ATPase [Crossiella cryophila]|uniref:AAA+ superfamily predicted ATPase n=1 Tax=Crossiella cryophila TaxID=43355 RepID=A0A7W7FV33_9PSEU|nr:AAA family ATPase [Crossiella cryophila]MBB4678862.1 AAA+ superfamily predicted ATPase [Crossiella cryophila]